MASNSTCPETHFRCPDPVYCLPVFLRCNGVKDCPYGEDELSCEDMTCPDYYRCRGSSVCLHPSQVCDGWPQCPERDDELLCNVTCPSACLCQGLAFVCHKPFPATKHPDLRYLDARGSGITPFKVSRNHYLMHLSLAFCHLKSWPEIHLPNLKHLDLSNNELKVVHIHRFVLLRHLKYISFRENPLTKLASDNYYRTQTSLVTVDLSQTRLLQFESLHFAYFPSLMFLNLSFSYLNILMERDLWHLPNLRELDLSGCKFENVPRDSFKRLERLRSLRANNFKVCCKANLPDSFNENFCYSPQDEVSSCNDLLRSNFYRSSLWTVSALSVCGNAGSFLFRFSLLFDARRISSHHVFVTNLSFSDFLMGVYLAIIGIADRIYHGQYLWYDISWKASAICKAGGFLSLLSSEVSVFMICLITLDRFIALHFPFSTFRFKRRSAAMVSALAWVCGVVLAAVPLLPALSHWRFYGHTGICIPLPVTRKTFGGKDYSFGLLIVFNCALFICIAIGQVFIYWSIKANSLETIEAVKNSRDITIARRLITVVVSDFICWFPIGVLGLMAFNGTPVAGEVNLALAIFVLPLNSALNPFLYTFNMLMERWRKAREARLLSILLEQALRQ